MHACAMSLRPLTVAHMTLRLRFGRPGERGQVCVDVREHDHKQKWRAFQRRHRHLRLHDPAQLAERGRRPMRGHILGVFKLNSRLVELLTGRRGPLMPRAG